MNMNLDHKIINFGYGGISCPCCTPLNTRKKNKTYSKRRFRQYLKKEQLSEEVEYFNYWLDPNDEYRDILNWEDDWRQIDWEQENVRYYHNHLEERDTMEDSSVYSQNTYQR